MKTYVVAGVHHDYESPVRDNSNNKAQKWINKFLNDNCPDIVLIEGGYNSRHKTNNCHGTPEQRPDKNCLYAKIWAERNCRNIYFIDLDKKLPINKYIKPARERAITNFAKSLDGKVVLFVGDSHTGKIVRWLKATYKKMPYSKWLVKSH